MRLSDFLGRPLGLGLVGTMGAILMIHEVDRSLLMVYNNRAPRRIVFVMTTLADTSRWVGGLAVGSLGGDAGRGRRVHRELFFPLS